MSGGGGANPTGAQFPAPVVAGLWNQANTAFQPVPYPNVGQAASNAYGDIGTGGTGTWAQSFGQNSWSPYNQAFVGEQSGLGAGQNFINQAQNQAAQVQPFINQTLAQGFDPQQALFNQLMNQQQQQNLASQAAAGVGNTPYGAGLTQQGNTNFDIAWQNAQLARQGQAASNAAALAGIPGVSAGIGNQLLGTGGQLGLGAGNFLNNLNQQQISDYLSYLQGSSGNAANLMNATLGALQAGTGLYGTTTTANQNANNAFMNALGGFGKLGGEVLGTALPLLMG